MRKEQIILVALLRQHCGGQQGLKQVGHLQSYNNPAEK